VNKSESLEGRILALSRVGKNRHIVMPINVAMMLKVEEKEYIAWVLEHGDIIVRKGKWLPPEIGELK